jgi:DNA helicase-2/ATP-dependent DNA helicase PcrA
MSTSVAPGRASALFETLNPAQRAAVIHGDGPLLVLAGAGSGKTRVLTLRIAQLIQDRGIDPAQILAVTFTNKAAGEMRDRLATLLGGQPAGMWAGTFHSTGARMLRATAALVGRSSNFTIYDEDDTLGVVKRVMEGRGISPREWTPKAIHAAISDAKNALVPPAEYTRLAHDPLSRAAAAVYADLEHALRAHNAVSFDDLLALPVQVLTEHADRRAAYQARFRYVLVDEYQDTNRAQYSFVKLLAAHGNVTVVGDDDQVVYQWRGADIRNILDFERDFPQAAIVRLEENYRSTGRILELANAVISANTQRMGKTLRATKEIGERAVAVRALDERDEAAWVVEEIVARRRADGDLALRDVAILYRTNAQSRAFEEAVRRQGLPYRLVGAVRFYDRREIRDVMSYLKLIANPADNEAFRHAIAVPRRGLGDAAMALLTTAAAAHGVSLLEAAGRPAVLEPLRPATRAALADFAQLIARLRVQAIDASVDELLRALVDAIRYGDYLRAEGPDSAERLDNIRELITSAAETVVDDGGEVGITPLEHFLQRASLVAGIDQLDPSADAIMMMTVHNAKGLEFPMVFITGLEDGLFPLGRAYDDPAMLEEERRLFYVGITRAERRLYLSYAEQRRRNGELLPGKESSFLAAVPDGMIERRETIRVRASGRIAFDGDTQWSSAFTASRAGSRRPGTPVTLGHRWENEADLAGGSQDVPAYQPGERVRHRTFGSGTIAEVSGVGHSAKVKVDFEDAAIGRKTLVIAQAGLQPALE